MTLPALEKAAIVVQFDKEAGQTRDYCVAKSATHRAARPDPSLREERLFRMTNQTAPLPKAAIPLQFLTIG
jgi:hypothetical protein